MPQNISKNKRSKSFIKETLANRRKAKFKDPKGYKNFPKDQLLGLGETALELVGLKGLGKLYKVSKKSLKSGKTFTKKKGGLTDTVPPKRGPNPQGLKHGGCPFREAGVKSAIKGVSGIQVKGQKFTGTK